MGSIAFDHSSAERLISALESADERVHHQGMQRSDAVDTAMTEFGGGYARAFSSNADNERRDRSDLCFHLLTVASQVKFAHGNRISKPMFRSEIDNAPAPVGQVLQAHAQDVYPFIENGQGDQWAWVGRDFSSEHGVNPMNEDFAATTFGTDSEVEGAGDPVNTHSTRQKHQTGYYEAGSEAVVNIGRILRGEEEHVSEHIDKGLTTYQQSLLGPGALYAP